MSNVFTLESLHEEVEKKFAPMKIPVEDGVEVVLQSVIRLGKKKREKATELLKSLDDLETGEAEEGEEVFSEEDKIDELVRVMHELILLVARSHGQKLVDALGDDVALLMTVINKWMETTQPGEASPSQN